MSARPEALQGKSHFELAFHNLTVSCSRFVLVRLRTNIRLSIYLENPNPLEDFLEDLYNLGEYKFT
jgi:hypothetical protein